MTFQEGKIANPNGRPGYTFEKEQLNKMRELLNKYLEVAERILGDNEKPRDEKKIQVLSADMRKILDKLHASPQALKVDGEIRMPIYLPSSLMQKHGLPQSTGTNSE